MKVLITGAGGFVGKNLVWELKNHGFSDADLLQYDIDTDPALLDEYTQVCQFVFHLAGVNRPKDTAEFMTGNFGFTTTLLDALKKNSNQSPVLITSSIHAAGDTPYGLSKRAGEDAIFAYGEETGAKVLVYRLQNLFGKWCRPNYNSAVATFCYNIAHNLPITVNDRATVVPLVYIDDLLEEFMRALAGKETRKGKFCVVETYYEESLGDIADLLYGFKKSRQTLDVPNVSDAFSKKLYSTYLSYLEPDDFTYPLNTHEDPRGFFAEAFKSSSSGQVSVNVSVPGITKGNHWHHSKIEKFLVVSGEGIIRFRKIDSDAISECKVSGNMLMVVDVPPGYTHSIVNTGNENMITIIWSSEIFDPEKPDTYPLEV